jgi:hypothetical protein
MWHGDRDMYCPECGEQGRVWWAEDGDFYAGGDYVCLDCATVFHLPHGTRKDPTRVSDVKKWLSQQGRV